MIRHAFRTLIRQPRASTVVVLTIAVAIAATTVIYSAIDLVWGFIPIVDRSGLVYVAATDTRVLQAGVVVRMLLAAGAKPVAAGGLVGLLAAIGLAVGIGLSVPGVEPRDPMNYLGVAGTIALVAFLASYIPAKRAASIDPVLALRQQ
jgi:hypothetical protein